MAVSYTHLDVYKRQIQVFYLNIPLELIKIRTSVADTVTKTYTETVFDQIVTVGEGMTAVSYTHLKSFPA